MSYTKFYSLVFVISFLVAIGFNLWLDSGCQLQGIVTTHGKVCMA